jgi:hypothetical protein
MKKVLGLAVIGALFLPAVGWAQPVVDNASSCGINDGSTTVTCSYTVNSNTNGMLTVCVYLDSITPTVSGITFNGVSLTQVDSVTQGSRVASLWRLTSTAGEVAGTHNIVITTPVPQNKFYSGATSFTNVNQTTPVGTPAHAFQTSNASPSVTVTSVTGALVVDCLGQSGGGTVATPAGGQTGQWSAYDGGLGGSGQQSTKAGAASVTMSWTNGGAVDWAITAVGINAPAGAAAAPSMMLGFTK